MHDNLNLGFKEYIMNLIRKTREALGLTLKDLSEKINVHYTTVSEWELGKIEPKKNNKLALAQALGKSVEELFPRDDLPKATHEGNLLIGDRSLDCAVLETGKRVMSQNEVFEAFGRRSRGKMLSRSDGADLPGFLDAKNLRPFITQDVENGIKQIEYISKSGKRRLGYDATIIPLVCDVYLDARKADVLTQNQQPIAEISEMIVRSLSKVGIVALVDEATGYQQERDRNELHQLLEKYLSEEKLAWAKRFPDEFFRQLYRLKDWNYPNGHKRTPLVGKLINRLVYEKLPPGVLENLRERNPTDPSTKRRKWKHHQFLSEDLGQPDLRDHLLQVIVLMRGSPNWTSFEKSFNLAFPNPNGFQRELDFDEEE